jgi:outer membrane protein assembly factor BamB
MLYAGTDYGDLVAVDLETAEWGWSQRLGEGVALTAAPTLADGVVYVGDSAGGMHAVDAGSGEKHWQVGLRTLWSSPAVIGGMLFVGANDGALRCVGISAE